MQDEEAVCMQKISGTLTVYFEEPFWVGVYERVSDGTLTVCKITFGAEPKDYDVYQFLLDHWRELRFSPPVPYDGKPAVTMNPKRMQRAIQRQLHKPGISTKSQQALKLQHETGKAERKSKSREQREAEKQRKFDLKRQKKKQKHRGR
jgi:hypothetical protein